MWEHCREWDVDIMMEVADFETLQQNDKELMKSFIQHRANGQDLTNLNHCQMYLRAIYLSNFAMQLAQQ